MTCWGYNDDGRADDRDGPFSTVSAGRKHTCGVNPDGTVRCWGWNHYGQTGVPSECWDSSPYGGEFTPPSYCPGWLTYGPLLPGGSATYPFLSVSAGGNHTCGVLTDHRVGCWGRNDDGQRSLSPTLFLDDTFRSISAGFAHTCGVHIDGSVDCWGNDGYNRASPPATTAFITDWHRYASAVQARAMLDLLLLDESNSRSAGCQLVHMQD